MNVALLLRAGALDRPHASLEHPLMRAVDRARPASRPGLGETLFCCRSMTEAVMWLGWAQRTHTPHGLAVHAIAARPERLFCYPAGLWEELQAGPGDRRSLARYWQAGIPWAEVSDGEMGGIWQDTAGVEVLVPVQDIVAVQTAFEAPISPYASV